MTRKAKPAFKWPVILTPLLGDRRLCVLIGGAPVLLAAVNALGIHFWRCPFNALTGLDCPGCGMTRAGAALLAGDFKTALTYHPLALPMALFFGFIMAAAIAPEAWRRGLTVKCEAIESKCPVAICFLAVFVIFGFARLAMQVYLLFGFK